MNSIIEQLAKEGQRIEEDAEHTAKGHYNAGSRWGRYHLWLGGLSAVIGAIAGGNAFGGNGITAGILGIISTALATTLTALKPSERAESHKSIADQYLALRNRTRIFRNIELLEPDNAKKLKATLLQLSEKRDELNAVGLSPSRGDYLQVCEDIDAGRTRYRVDKKAAK